jgi:hypothetical protein
MTDLLSDPSEPLDSADDYAGIDPALAKRLRDKDSFIEQLKSEKAEVVTQLRARTSLEEITERIARQAQQAPDPDSKRVADPLAPPEPEDISAKVLKILQEEKTKANRDGNVERSRAGLRERFGADYNLYLKKASAELGVSEKFLADLAATSPDGLLKTIDALNLKDTETGSPPPSSVDTSKQYNQTVRKNKAYYSKMLKDDRSRYFSAAIQSEIHAEAMRQGDKFFE